MEVRWLGISSHKNKRVFVVRVQSHFRRQIHSILVKLESLYNDNNIIVTSIVK